MATSPRTVSGGESCPECAGTVRPDGTEQICASCGLVVDEHEIDHGPEWRSFTNDEHPRKRAEPTNPHRQGKGLGSEIGYSSSVDPELKRQRRLHSISKASDKREWNLRYVIGEIGRMAGALEIGHGLRKQAVELFKRLHESQEHHGNDLDTLAATSIYTTCRMNQRGLRPENVAEVSRDAEPRIIARRHKWLCNELGIGAPPPCPKQRVRVVARECGLSREVAERAVARLDTLDESLVYSGSPSTLAAGLLYDAAGGRGGSVTQRELAEAAGCSKVSVRNRWKDVRAEGQTTVEMW